MKKRLDQWLLEHHLAETRSKAQSLIILGKVVVNGSVMEKPGYPVPEGAEIVVKESPLFVSRGGDKLAPVLDDLPIVVQDRICLDVGSSTGGFTDVLLQRGAQLVYAVDVGTNQLAYSLRTNPRVRAYEQTHVLDLTADRFNPYPTLAVVDVSFISVTKILPVLLERLALNEVVILVKPQFEMGKDLPHFKGVVHRREDQLKAVKRVCEAISALHHVPRAIAPAPIQGPKGNQEYFIWSTHDDIFEK